MQIGGLRMPNAYLGNTGTQGGNRKIAQFEEKIRISKITKKAVM